MAPSTPISKTIYIRAFAHSTSLGTIEICPNGAMGVDPKGIIAFVENNAPAPEEIKKSHPDWQDARTITLPGQGFFYPGFIDTHIHAP
jgi:guanine deaminase